MNEENPSLDPVTAEQIRFLDGVISSEHLTPQEIAERYGVVIHTSPITSQQTTYRPLTHEDLSNFITSLETNDSRINALEQVRQELEFERERVTLPTGSNQTRIPRRTYTYGSASTASGASLTIRGGLTTWEVLEPVEPSGAIVSKRPETGSTYNLFENLKLTKNE